MKATNVLLTVTVALILQMALARFAVGGRWAFDLVLVAVVYAALYWGPVAGMWTGTIGGLLQDTLGGEVIGSGGLAKTVVGFAAGVAGGRFMVVGPSARAGIVAIVTVAHRLTIIGLLAVAGQEWRGVSWTAMLIETGFNAAAGLIAFQVTERLPGVVRQTRRRRTSSLSRRNW